MPGVLLASGCEHKAPGRGQLGAWHWIAPTFNEDGGVLLACSATCRTAADVVADPDRANPASSRFSLSGAGYIGGCMSRLWSKTHKMVTNTGLRGTAAFLCKEKIWRFARRVRPDALEGFVYQLRSRFSPGPVFVRAGSSDRRVFRQVLINLEYDCFRNMREPRLIVDCGANVGYASLFFLGRYPSAHVIAIEPESGNFALLERNLAPFAGRTTTIQSAVWSHSTCLSIRRGQFGDGREWATQVVETPAGEDPDIQAVDLAEVLAASGFPRIDILKVDVERAEAVLFRPGAERWLDRVDNLAIELHDAECESVLFQAVQGKNFTLSRHGELTVLEGLRSRDGTDGDQRPKDD